MAIALKRRRVVAVKVESANGTYSAPVPSEAVPQLRAADAVVTPASVERPSLRLSLTTIGDIYPGKGTVQITFEFEMHASSSFTGDASVIEIPIFYRIIRGCAFAATTFGSTLSVRGYKITTAATDLGPLRHDELITANSTTPIISADGWKVYGDTYADDGLVFLQTGAAGSIVGATQITGVTSGSVFNMVPTAGPIIFGFDPQSNINSMEALSLSVWVDGKRINAKGCMGNIEFRFRYSEPIVAACTFEGVFVGYVDEAMPTSPNELHKFPPTFLGPRLTIRKGINAPSAAQKYGTAAAAGGGNEGALSEVDLRTGNTIVLRKNAIDPNGVNFAIIADRAPTGRFDPDEVLSSEFDWVDYFVRGEPLRMKIETVGPDATAVLFDDPNTANQNIYDYITPGVQLTQLGDADRDGINTWDGQFRLTGGDYDTSVLGEAPGADNEFAIIHR